MDFKVYDPQSRRLVAKVHLNGHNIEPGGPLGQAGAMRSFTIVEGSVFAHWAAQHPLILKQVKDDGREAPIRIAALPAEQGESGFIEFL